MKTTFLFLLIATIVALSYLAAPAPQVKREAAD
jgi:hypothetical protein